MTANIIRMSNIFRICLIVSPTLNANDGELSTCTMGCNSTFSTFSYV